MTEFHSIQYLNELEIAWIYRTGELERLSEVKRGQQSFENTPNLIAGSLIVCTPTGRVVALDPKNGKERWVYDPNQYPLPADIRYPKCRGVSHWVDQEAKPGAPCQHRIMYGTWEFKVFAIDDRQYLVIAAGGHALYQTTPSDYVIAYSLGPVNTCQIAALPARSLRANDQR